MSNNDKYGLKYMSDDELYTWIAGWKPSAAEHIAGTQELRRRNESQTNLRAWIAIDISVFSLIVSIIAIISK